MSAFDTREKPLDKRLESSLVGRNLSPGSVFALISFTNCVILLFIRKLLRLENVYCKQTNPVSRQS